MADATIAATSPVAAAATRVSDTETIDGGASTAICAPTRGTRWIHPRYGSATHESSDCAYAHAVKVGPSSAHTVWTFGMPSWR